MASGGVDEGLRDDRGRRAASWLARRSYRAEQFPVELLIERKRAPVTVVLPARDVVETLPAILAELRQLHGAGLIDELVVVDANSTDGTGQAALAGGATLLQESDLMTELGPARGKGDALWRALSATHGELVCFIDADTEGFSAEFALGLLGPLICFPEIELVKGAYARPFRVDGQTLPEGGGRVTELLARPLLALHAPELAAVAQPLAGETAARRQLLERLPFAVGYGVELALLIDAYRDAGLDAIAQVDLGSRQNRHQPLGELTAMAYAVLVAAERRFRDPGALADAGALLAARDGELVLREVPVEERPPLASVLSRARD